jgi:alpha-1,3/alpha-1,6-mannosyltransferase
MKKVAFIHPDLGIGGAERLVVDAAVGLRDLDNDITIYTSHCDPTHCFEEVKSLNVKVYGDFLPTNILKKFHILCAILRQFYLVVKMVFMGEVTKYDYFIIDQLSFCIPILVLFKGPDARILFYCHFPDQLLAIPTGTIKKIYRAPFNWFEEYTTSLSDVIVVNSQFTKSVFHSTFNINTDPKVIYPCVDIDQAIIETEDDKRADEEVKQFFKVKGQEVKFFLSINRFERKKNIELAIKAFKLLKEQRKDSENTPTLVISGGFDPRVRENVEYLNELNELCESLDLKAFTIRGKLLVLPPATDVLFLPSVKSVLKNALLKNAVSLLYTPKNEHFGIVPVESMLCKTIVLGPDSGGPVESIVDYKENELEATGFNVSLVPEQWSATMDQILRFDTTEKQRIGNNGFKAVLKRFSRQSMSDMFIESLTNAQDTYKGVGILCAKVLVRYWVWVLVLVFSIALRYYRQ